MTMMNVIKPVISVTTSAVTSVWEIVGAEAVLLVCFCLGFLLFNTSTMQAALRFARREDAAKAMEADFARGDFAQVLDRAQKVMRLPAEALALACRALQELGRGKEVCALLDAHAKGLTAEHLNAVLGVVDAALLGDVRAWFAQAGVAEDAETVPALLAAFAAAEDWDAVQELAAAGATIPARLYSKLVKDALKREALTEAADHMAAMQGQGLYVPAQLVAQLARTGARAGRTAEVPALLERLSPGGEALAAVLDACHKDAGLAELLEAVLALLHKDAACEDGKLDFAVALPAAAYCAVVKAFAKTCDARAFQYFDAMVAAGHTPTDATSVAVVQLCSEGRNVPLAEHVLAAARARGAATNALYSAVMKVYGVAKLHAKTCDLVAKLAEDGLTPDNAMYGVLIKSAVECGRLELSRTLLRKSGTMDIQNYMSLFRACGREKNVPRALELLAELEASAIGIDTTAYNCVLDVCVKSQDRGAVQTLFAKMKASGFVDTISFNTLLKAAHGARSAKVLEDMKEIGLSPNQITYNSLINNAVSSGDVAMAWKYVSLMRGDGIPLDNFTCSIMMKGLKHTTNKDDVDNTLSLIEQAQIVPDEVLVNTLLDACIRLRDVKRLSTALEAFRRSGAVPSDHAYGTVLRAYGHARALPEAWATWNEMLARKVPPTEATFAAMVDACVSNGAVDDALDVFRSMKAQIPDFATPSGIYLALIKVLAQRKETTKAMEVYADMRASRVQPSLATFNALIDVCARQGDVDRAAQLFRDMCSLGVTPDLITYSTVIKGYCVQGDLEQAIQLFTLMRKRGIQPDAILFNSILDGAARKQMTSLVEQVLGDMDGAGIAPSNFTLSILVKLYGRAQDLDTALRHVDTMPAKYGFVANDQVYTCLVAACANCGRMAQAYEVFRKLASPDAKAYQTVITGALKHNDVSGALQFLERGVAARVGLGQDLVDNVTFMAQRRKLSSQLQALAPKLATAGYTTRPAAAAEQDAAPSRVQERRGKAQSWRDIVVARE